MAWLTRPFLSAVLTASVALICHTYFFQGPSCGTIQTSYGEVVGTVARSREGRLFSQFLGIPYARPPIGKLRYEPPLPPEKWKGVWEATNYRNMCLQINSISRSVEGDENCLFLNIFSPNFVDGTSKIVKPLLPVFVYIHGGYFMAGGSNYMGPSYLMEEEIVLVTLNYRLNSFGFLNTGDGIVRGNMGMRDQVLALKFVKKEIQNFGGNPDNVIIWGESAGAAAVHFHLLSPMSKGLFHKAIMSSGTAIKPWSLVNDPKAQTDLLAKTVGCSSNRSKEVVRCLKSLDAKTLIDAHLDALDSPIMNSLKIFAPSIETEKDGEDFLSEHPYDILKEGRAHRVPLLTGVNSDEGLLATARMYFNRSLAKQVETDWDSLSPTFFSYKPSLTNVTKKIRDFYFGEDRKLSFYAMFQEFTDVFSDRWYIHSFKETVRIQSRYSNVYIYYFSYPLERGLIFFYDLTPKLPIIVQVIYKVISEWVNWVMHGTKPVYLGTVHGDELVLLFNFPMVYIDVGHKDYEMSRLMIETWIAFAKDETQMYVGNRLWPAYNASLKEASKYMFFRNAEIERGILIEEPFPKRMAFWDRLGLPWKPTIS